MKDNFPDKKIPFASTAPLLRDEILDASPTRLNCYLKIITFEEEEKIFELYECDITIGRSIKCDIQIPIKSISRKHALISFHNEEYYMEDLNSKNGTYLNGMRIAKCALRNKDQIDIGGVKIIFNEKTSLIKT